jgi:hypothetical protein
MVDKEAFAAERSHEDAKAANALYQAAGQAAILINGGASTAILAFAAAEKAVIRISAVALGWSLACFALGVVAGAFVIGFQATSVQRWVIRWQGEALSYSKERVTETTEQATKLGTATHIAFVLSMCCFLLGAVVLAASLGSTTPPAPQAH